MPKDSTPLLHQFWIILRSSPKRFYFCFLKGPRQVWGKKAWEADFEGLGPKIDEKKVVLPANNSLPENIPENLKTRP